MQSAGCASTPLPSLVEGASNWVNRSSMCHCLPCVAFWESPLYWVVAESLLLMCVCLWAELGGLER